MHENFPEDLLFFIFHGSNVGQLARHQYEGMRKEAASVKIQKYSRMYLAKNAYKFMWASSIYIQNGMRGMAARNEFRFRKQRRAAIIIQVGKIKFFNSWEN